MKHITIRDITLCALFCALTSLVGAVAFVLIFFRTRRAARC